MSDEKDDTVKGMMVNETKGGIVVDDDGKVSYVIRFTGWPLNDDEEMPNYDDQYVFAVALLPTDAAELVGGLTALVAEHSPNELYDAGVVAARVGVPPAMEEP